MGTAALVKPAKTVVLTSLLVLATGVGAGAQDAPVPLGTMATTPLSSFYQNPPAGTLLLGNVTFTVGNLIVLGNGAAASYAVSYSTPTAVHFLINTQNTSMFWDSMPVGDVTLTFSNGATQTVSLIPGTNVREWRVGAAGTDNTVTDTTDNVQVWSGSATDGTAAVIDMLTVPVVAPNNTATLTGISVSNTNTFGSLNIVLSGLTVSYTTVNTDPKPRRPGNSGNTAAMNNSQAGSHSNSYVFTGQSPAQGQADSPVGGTTEQSTTH